MAGRRPSPEDVPTPAQAEALGHLTQGDLVLTEARGHHPIWTREGVQVGHAIVQQITGSRRWARVYTHEGAIGLRITQAGRAAWRRRLQAA